LDDIARALKFRPELVLSSIPSADSEGSREFAEILLRVDRSLAAGDICPTAKLALDYFTDGQEFIW
jgi:hypothetical protein